MPFGPSSIYSWSIGHILEHEFFSLGRLCSQGSKEKKSGFEVFGATFEGVFFNFVRSKKMVKSCRVRTKKLQSIKVRKK